MAIRLARVGSQLTHSTAENVVPHVADEVLRVACQELLNGRGQVLHAGLLAHVDDFLIRVDVLVVLAGYQGLLYLWPKFSRDNIFIGVKLKELKRHFGHRFRTSFLHRELWRIDAASDWLQQVLRRWVVDHQLLGHVKLHVGVRQRRRLD